MTSFIPTIFNRFMFFFSKNERFQVVLGFGDQFGDQFGEEMGLEQSNPNYL
jgi:hypothetical protein